MSDWGQRSRGNYGNRQGGYGNKYPEDREEPQRYPNSGALFPVKQKRSDNSPDMTGNILIADDVLDYILREAEKGDDVKMELSAWIRTGRNNNTFTSIKINIPYDQRVLNQNPTYRARPNFNAQRREPDEPRQREHTATRGGYAEQSRGETTPGGRFRTDPPRPPARQTSQEEFARGDRMPDFLRDDDDDPTKPPF
jgi:hypothetical protein